MKHFSWLLLVAIGVSIGAGRVSCFPRMVNQPSLRPFEREMPAMPQNLVPFSGPAGLPSDPAQAAKVTNPVKPTPEAVTLGRIYYGYYCEMCHGARGDGDGAVGRSYIPKPSDLTSSKVQASPDGALALAMVTGPGHSPVLDSTVPLERRWYIVHYLRSLRTTQRD